jgi:4-phosphopantoate---beta-alanine ligase
MAPKTHPRYESLTIREKIIDGVNNGITSIDGLIAHGRGEAFDYFLGEKTSESAKRSIDTAAALLRLAKYPVISVNGNSAALAGKDLVRLSKIIPAKLEVNIFHSSEKRELKIKNHLLKCGAGEVLLPQKNVRMRFISSNRKYVNKDGIYKADVVLVPLEDGDRTEALIGNGKKVAVVDLNPLSRSAQKANISIIDSITRAVPLLIKSINRFKKISSNLLRKKVENYDNKKTLSDALRQINKNLR